jgi:hypothetical protein
LGCLHLWLSLALSAGLVNKFLFEYKFSIFLGIFLAAELL